MTGNEYLKQIGLIKQGYSEFKIKFDNGTSILLGDVLESYAERVNKTKKE